MIVFAVIIAVLILIMNLSVHVKTKLQDQKFSVVVRLGKIKILKAPVFEKKQKENKSPAKEQTKTDPEKTNRKITADDITFYFSVVRDALKDLQGLLRYTRKKIICNRLLLELTFGKEDAAQVGMMCGFLWAGLGNLLPLLQSMMVLKEHRITVVPVYHQECFSVAYEGVFRMKVHHLVVIAFKALGCFFKYSRRFSKHKSGASQASRS